MQMGRAFTHFLFLISIGAALYLVNDLRGTLSTSSKRIALVTQITGKIKKLSKGELSWKRTQNGSSFDAGDAISVYGGGKVTLLFNDGSEIELNEGTLMVLGRTEEKIELNFDSGSARLRVAGQEKLDSFAITQIAPPITRLPAQTTAPNKVSVEVINTPVKTAIAKPKPTPPILPQKKPVKPPAAKAPNAPLLTTPQHRSTFFASPKQSVYLNWQPAREGTKTTHFEVIVQSLDGTTEKITVPASQPFIQLNSLKEGSYTWFVRAIGQTGLRSPASEQRTVEIKPLLQKTLLQKPVLLKPQLLKPRVVNAPTPDLFKTKLRVPQIIESAEPDDENENDEGAE